MYVCLSVKEKYVTASVDCVYKNKNYLACEIMLYTKWKPCNGTDCQLGLQIHAKGICCPKTGNETTNEVKEKCKMNCNITDADFFETATYIPPSTTPTTKPGSNASLAEIIKTTSRSSTHKVSTTPTESIKPTLRSSKHTVTTSETIQPTLRSSKSTVMTSATQTN
jgi:hypothetical protein